MNIHEVRLQTAQFLKINSLKQPEHQVQDKLVCACNIFIDIQDRLCIPTSRRSLEHYQIRSKTTSIYLAYYQYNTAMDPGLNELLKWGVENSSASRDPDSSKPATEPKGLSAEALRALMGGPFDADLMKEAMAIIISISPEVTAEAKMTAFDNFEQLVENLDNANNIQPLGLWTPLLSQLDSAVADMRMMAAWCAGTAVQNNVKSQERLLAMNGVEKLCKVAVEDQDKQVRRKAIYALSSSVRNYQPAMNEAVKFLPKEIVQSETVQAEDMDTIDGIMGRLRER